MAEKIFSASGTLEDRIYTLEQSVRGLAPPEFTAGLQVSSGYYTLVKHESDDLIWSPIDATGRLKYTIPEGTSAEEPDQAASILDAQLLMVQGNGVDADLFTALPNGSLYVAGLRRTILAIIEAPTETLNLAVTNIKDVDGGDLESIIFDSDQAFLILECWDDSGIWRVVRGTATITPAA